MTGAKHTPGPLQVRMTGTCSAAWAEIGEECVDPDTNQPWWRELGRVETTHLERTGPRGKAIPGPVGSIEDRPDRFVLLPEGEEHIANAILWAASPDLLSALRAADAALRGLDVDTTYDMPAGLRAQIDAAIAKAFGSAT